MPTARLKTHYGNFFTSTGTSIVVPVLGGLGAGDIAIVAIDARTTLGTITSGSGMTLLATYSAGTTNLQVWWKKLVTTADLLFTTQFSMGGNTQAYNVLGITNCKGTIDTYTAFGGFVTGATNYETAATTITTGVINCLILSINAVSGFNQNMVAGSAGGLPAGIDYADVFSGDFQDEIRTEYWGQPAAGPTNPVYLQDQNSHNFYHATVLLSIPGIDDTAIDISQFYVNALYSTDARYRATQLSIDVAALNSSEVRLTQQALAILHSYATVRYHTSTILLYKTRTASHITTWAGRWIRASTHDTKPGIYKTTLLSHDTSYWTINAHSRHHNADYLAYKITTQTHTTRPLTRGTHTSIHTTDTFSLRFVLQTHYADADIHGANYRFHGTSSLYRATTGLGHATDTTYVFWVSLPHSTRTNVWGTIAKSHKTSAMCLVPKTIWHDTDASIYGLSLRAAHTTIANIRGIYARSHHTVGIPRGTYTRAAGTDAWALYIATLSHGIDADLGGTTNLAHHCELSIQGTYALAHDTGTCCEPFKVLIYDSDTMLKYTSNLAHSSVSIVTRPITVDAIPQTYKFTYKDDYGQIYTSIYTATGSSPFDKLDITTIIEQPYVWGRNNGGYVQNHNLYRDGIITIQRMILEGTLGGYVTRAESNQQWADTVMTSFNCYDAPVDPFKYHLSANNIEQLEMPATAGWRFTDVGDDGVVWGEVKDDGTMVMDPGDYTIGPDGTVDTTLILEYVDVWGEDVPALTPWRVRIGVSLLPVLAARNLGGLMPVTMPDAAALYRFPAHGYKYLCVPEIYARPFTFTDPDSSIDGGATSVIMADPGDAAVYSNLAAGNYYAVITATNRFGQTMDYRIYRTKYKLGAAIPIRVDG